MLSATMVAEVVVSIVTPAKQYDRLLWVFFLGFLFRGVMLCEGGITGSFLRKREKCRDMPLDSDVFRVPSGYNAPQQECIEWIVGCFMDISFNPYEGSYYSRRGVIISWVTMDEPGSNIVLYGTSKNQVQFRDLTSITTILQDTFITVPLKNWRWNTHWMRAVDFDASSFRSKKSPPAPSLIPATMVAEVVVSIVTPAKQYDHLLWVFFLGFLFRGVLLCEGGITGCFLRKREKSRDMPLDSDVFRVPSGYNVPQQVHITQGDQEGRGVIISWVTMDEPGSNIVLYGTSKNELQFRDLTSITIILPIHSSLYH